MREVLGLGFLALLVSTAMAQPTEIIDGEVRIQFLSDSLLRLEQRGPQGFEDRKTFTVINRPKCRTLLFPKSGFTQMTYRIGNFWVEMPANAKSLSDVVVKAADGSPLYHFEADFKKRSFMPSPSSMPKVWIMADWPRILPPSWGATPTPQTSPIDPTLVATSGWDLGNDAPDIYLFSPGKGGYNQFKKDFLTLTGPTPMPPLRAFGFIDSRYHPYTQEEALGTIDTYRKKGIPLDGFVVDTDWRVGASKGYEVDTKLFPDMPKFIQDAHSKNVWLMYNDHPEPQTATALDPKEMAYRWKGLTSMLGMGVDVWWYDRNWSTHLVPPAPGLQAEIWGQRVFHDITERFRPADRPLIMSNVQGIDNGKLNYAPHPASHRYPIWWTGDTQSTFTALKEGVSNGVNSGINGLLPYVNEDLGGHVGAPSPELYVRFLQYGCLCPITRIHCTRGRDRHPWAYGPEAERIVTEYIKSRYKLLPTIYSAARRCFEDGTPLLRRLDLEWPLFKEAQDPTEYLLGDDMLVAPIVTGLEGDAVAIPAKFLSSPDGSPGLKASYFANKSLSGPPALNRTDATLDFNWQEGSPDSKIPTDDFSAVWEGSIGPVPMSGTYSLALRADDGVRLFVDGKQVIDAWKPQDNVTNIVKLQFEQGSKHSIRVEYFEEGGDALVSLGWLLPNQMKPIVSRSVWIPPGTWVDAWTGAPVLGPKSITVSSPLWHLPIWVRAGGAVISGPAMQYTGEKPWDSMTVDAYLPSVGEANRTLYEDDGISPSYGSGAFRKTTVTVGRKGQKGFVSVGQAEGSFSGGPRSRQWTVRVHLPAGTRIRGATLDGKRAVGTPSELWLSAIPHRLAGQSAAGGSCVEVSIPASSIHSQHQIVLTLGK